MKWHPKDPNWERKPTSASPFNKDDAEAIKAEMDKLGGKKILEFGPGNSTEVLADLGYEVCSLEHIDKWLEVARERFKDRPNVRIRKFLNTMPVECHEVDGEKFDLGFVDSPQGWGAAREKLPGYEDCSRINSTLFALERCKVVMLHDVYRPSERGTLGRLNKMGYLINLVTSRIGMAVIRKREDGDKDV